MKEIVNTRLEQIWDDVTEELRNATDVSDMKKLFVAYGFLENIILNLSDDIKDPEVQKALLNYCEFAKNGVLTFGSDHSNIPEIRETSAKVIQFPKK